MTDVPIINQQILVTSHAIEAFKEIEYRCFNFTQKNTHDKCLHNLYTHEDKTLLYHYTWEYVHESK